MAAESYKEKKEEGKKDGHVVRFLKWLFDIVCKDIIAKYVVPLIIAGLGSDLLKVARWREVRQGSLAVIIDRPGPWTDVLFYYSVVSTIGGLLSFFLSQFLKRRATVNRTGRAAIILAFNIFLLLSAFFFSPSFLIPKVEPRMDISGQVTKYKENYYLFVRPTDSQRCWLQEPIPLLPDHNGHWNAVAYFGGRSGQLFELIAIAPAEPLHPNPLRGPGSYDSLEIRAVEDRFVRLVRVK